MLYRDQPGTLVSVPDSLDTSSMAEANFFGLDNGELDAARDLYHASSDLSDMLRSYRNLFNDDVRDALDECNRALEKASAQNW